MLINKGISNHRNLLIRLLESGLVVVSLLLNAFLMTLLLVRQSSVDPSFRSSALVDNGGAHLHSEAIQWNGGHPADTKTGSCYCSGSDHYCMCTPSLAIDLVIASGTDYVWLVRRKDINQLATMGGFVMVGETTEQAVKREIKEETGIDLQDQDPILLGVYSDPRRDNRRHTASAVYVVHFDGTERPKAADDVKDVKRVHLDDIERFEYFADHKTILMDYRSLVRDGSLLVLWDRDFANDIVRSVCSTRAIRAVI